MLRSFRPGPVAIAILLTLGLIAWLVSGAVNTFSDVEPATAPQPIAPPMQVETRWMDAERHSPRLTLQGQIEPMQQLDFAAQIAAVVEELPVAAGATVNKGELLVRLSLDARQAQVERFEAEVRQRESELAAVERLRGSGMQTQTEQLRLRGELARARAELAAARLGIAHTRPVAPFDAVLDRRMVEVGDYVQPGTPLVRLVAVDRLKVTAQVPQQEVIHLVEGQHADIDLLDGRRLPGTLTFIASAAEPGTRSFRIELEVDNPERLRIAGASATLRVHLPSVMAHRVSAALLALDQDGRLGLRLVDEHDQVVVAPVRLLSVDNEGAWVTGIGERVRLITRGAGFVEPGERVVAVDID
ncbi:MAG TPA: efflux RND transporter periplasmic adaptor subunit [Rhodocyclaceae bacterium]|nr:efflux RND transporter periplasmic adaptor subunit [Rhodocyclaceae bacterium]